MNCSNCGQPLTEQDRFCDSCGEAVAVRRKRARLWPAFLMLALIFAFGFSVFLLNRPVKPVDKPTLNENIVPWFAIENGVLFFNKTKAERQGFL